MQKYKEINGNDYVKNSRTTINETMQSIQSMNSGTAFPTTNLFEGMKCYRTDLKKTYTLTDAENGTWVEDAHATLADTATKLQTPRTLSLTGKASGSTTFDGSANASINVTSVNADTASKLSTARKINITGDATGEAAFDGTSDVSINVNVSQAAHADKATADANGSAFTDTNAYMHISALADSTDFNNVKTTGIYYCTGNTYPNRPHNSWGILTVYFIGTVKQEYRPDNAAVYYTRIYNNTNWTAWSKVNAANADTATKLATPRAISLTGNATGSGTFDGSGDVNISITVNESKHAAAATTVNAAAPNGGAADLVFGTMATNDYARIRVGGNNDDGWLEIATSDNGSESIYVRQYNGAYDWLNGRGTIANEAVLLDGNGNTKFPKNVTAANFVGHLAGNADTATNANHATSADSANTAANANKLSDESGSNYVRINTTDDSWSVIGPNPGAWLKSVRTDGSAPPYSLGNYSAGIAFGGDDTKGIITHAYDCPAVKFAGGKGSTAGWKFTIYGGYNNETYNLNNFPTKTGDGASGTWGINITGNADTVDGYHASDIISKITAANTGGIVAASLTENGYVKFANGLILQWGTLVGSKVDDSWVWVTTTFPVAFASACFSVACCDEMISSNGYVDNVEFMVRNVKTKSVDIRYCLDHHGRNVRWIAVGV